MDAVDRFRTLLRIPTVSREDASQQDAAAFSLFRSTLAELYPLVHAHLELDLIDGESLLYRWPGQEPDGRPS